MCYNSSFRMAYVTLVFSFVLLTFGPCQGISSNSNRVRRQIPYPLNQIFQQNAAASNTDFDYDFGGNDPRVVQPVNSENPVRNQIQSQLPQIVSNLIIASAVQQPPAPQQVIRTIMNSGLKR